MSVSGEFASWWLARMRELLPAWLRRGAPLPDVLAVVLPASAADAAPEATLVLRRRGREAPIGRVVLGRDGAAPTMLRAALGGRRPAATELRVPPGMLLEREVELPLAAERDLDRALGFEMDRLTPFRAEQVFWTRAVTGRDRAANRLRLRLSLVPRHTLDGVVAMLAAGGVAPSVLVAPRRGGGDCRIALGEPHGRRPAWPAVAAACAALCFAATAAPFALQWRERAALEARVEALRPAVAEAEALRRRATERAGGHAALAAEAVRLGSPLRGIATVTAVLPDDTFLTQLAVRQRRITLTGQSADAARLISRLSADPALRDAAFQSPVTRAERDGAELFTIQVELGS